MRAVQLWDFCSSPVASNILRFNHPMTPLPGPPALVHSVWLASSAKTRWCVGKHVLISVIFPVRGSYIERWRLDDSSGVSFAEGWSEPRLQKSGLAGGRTREVNHTRPFSSYIGLCVLVWLSQIGSGPQIGEGSIVFALDDGVRGSRTSIFTCVALWLTGSSTGKRSVLSSVAPYRRPFGLSLGFLLSVEMT